MIQKIVGYIGVTAFVLCGCGIDSLFSDGAVFVIGCFITMVVCGFITVKGVKNGTDMGANGRTA